MRLFKRRASDEEAFVLEAEEHLREWGWTCVSGSGEQSVWAKGGQWLSFRAALNELMVLVAPDPDEEEGRPYG